MQIGCSSASLHREIPQRMALLDFPAWCGSQGIRAVEFADYQLTSHEPEYLSALRRACDHAGVQIACLATANDFTIPHSDGLFAQVERVRALLYDVAAPLGAPLLRVFLGMADTSEAGDQRALETFRGMVTDMEATEITLVLENIARAQTSPEKMAAIIAGVGTPMFGCCLNLGSQPPERRDAMVHALAPLTRYVHAASTAFDAVGNDTTIDYRRALAVLSEYGYDGIFSIEYQGGGDPYQDILRTKALIERLWYYPASGMEQRAA